MSDSTARARAGAWDAGVLVLDLGTSALKAGVCAADGVLRAAASVVFDPPRARDDGRVEGDPRAWLDALSAVGRRLRADGALEGLGAVVVTGHGPSLVAVGPDTRPLGPALLWLDRRAAPEAEEIRGVWGRPVESWHFLPKALWLARHDRGRYEASAHLLSCPEMLLYTLTGRAVTVLHTPAFQHYYWDDDVVRKLGLDPGRFPPFVEPGYRVGVVGGPAALRTGLPEGTPVFAGGPDFLMSLLGTGCVRPGEVCDRAGSSEGINFCSERQIHDPRLACHPHLVKPRWNVAGMIPASGLAVDWIRSVAGRSSESHEELFETIARVPPGSRGVLFRSFHQRGEGGEFQGLALGHGYPEMARAVVESVGREILGILDRMRRNGLHPQGITVTGGQARLDRWSQIKADMTGLDVHVPRVPDAELVGGAVVGFVALGIYPDLLSAADRMVAVDRVFRPDPSAASWYQREYRGLPAAQETQPGSSSSR